MNIPGCVRRMLRRILFTKKRLPIGQYFFDAVALGLEKGGFAISKARRSASSFVKRIAEQA